MKTSFKFNLILNIADDDKIQTTYYHIIDIDILSKKINTLLNDPVLRKRLGHNGRKHFLGKYQIHIFRENMQLLYDKLTKTNLKSMRFLPNNTKKTPKSTE